MCKIIIVQPVVPKYRVPFFEALNKNLGNRLFIFSSSSWVNAPKSSSLNIENFNSTLRNLSLKNKIFYQSLSPILKNIKRGDIVIISGNPRIISNYILILYCKVVNAKVIWWGHGWSAGSRGFFAFLRQRLMHLSDATLLYTDEEKEQYQKLRILNRPIFALNNGIDLDDIDNYSKLSFINYNAKGNIAIFCGRLAIRSNILLLIKAVEQSKTIDKLILIGGGELYASCLEYITENNLSDKIELHGAIFDPKKLSELFSRASLFTFPGTVGLSLIHAMAYGLPAVLHDVRSEHGPENSAADKNNSVFFKKNDAVSLKDAIDSFFSKSNEDRINMAKAARRVVENKFNTRAMVVRFLEMLQYFK